MKFVSGWRRDLPDWRDFDMSHAFNAHQLKVPGDFKVESRTRVRAELSSSYSTPEEYCPDSEDQGVLGTCTAHALTSVGEYFIHRASGDKIQLSRRFLYRTTRRLDGMVGDVGASLRTTMKAFVTFGVPPEDYWPYNDDIDQEPDAFVYALAQSFQGTQYLRLDQPKVSTEDLLYDIRSFLQAGYPSVFGFPVFSSMTDREDIPAPKRRDRVLGGHAVAAFGYDDDHQNKGTREKGAIRILNSWGPGWGYRGWGWLPYVYVLDGMAVDWWTLLNAEWIDAGDFHRPR